MKNLFVLALLSLAVTSCIAKNTTTTDSTTTVTQTSPTEQTTTEATSPTEQTTTEATSPTEQTTTEAPATTSPTVPTSEPTTKSSSTAAPTTPKPSSTTQVPTTAPVPSTTKSPIPFPEKGHWNVTEGNTTCIRAELSIRFKISFKDHEEYMTLSPNASTEKSRCQTTNGTQSLVFTDLNYELMMIFEKDSDNVYIRNTSFSYNLPERQATVLNNTRMFSVKTGSCYLCTATNDIIFDNVTMEVVFIKLQAFLSEKSNDFGTIEECAADNQVNDIVPIAVGVALLALVVVVLIAYLVGRRRSRQKGYQSV